MKRSNSQKPSRSRTPAILHTSWQPFFGISGLVAAGLAVAAVGGCTRSPDTAQPTANSNVAAADQAASAAPASATKVVDQTPAAAAASTLSAKPSAIRYVNSASSGEAVVSGTSTLHNWTVKAATIQGSADFSGEWKADPANPQAISSIELSIPVNSLKSTEGGGMDDKVYEALNLKKFPTITYKLTKASLKSAPAKEGAPWHFDATGELSVAGNSHPISLDLAVLPGDGGRLTISADVAMKMTDCGVTPPTAMFGVVKAGDAITVNVTWRLEKKP